MFNTTISRRTALKSGAVALGAVALAGCSSSSEDSGSAAEGSAAVETTTLTVAATPSPHADILNDYAAPILAEQGIDLVVDEYTDYIVPNEVVSSGETDANYFQHFNYLNNYNEENGTTLVSVGAIHFEPMAVFPGKSSDLSAIAEGAQLAVPNDTTNEGRALVLLEELGIITLDDEAGIEGTAENIAENPYGIEIVEAEAATLPSLLADVDFAVINGNYAIDAGLSLADDAVASESADSDIIKTEYANCIVVNEGNEENEAVLALVAVLTTDEFAAYLEEEYAGAVIAAF